MQTAKTNTKSTGQFFAGIIRQHGTSAPFSRVHSLSDLDSQVYAAHMMVLRPPCCERSRTRRLGLARTKSSRRIGCRRILVCSACSVLVLERVGLQDYSVCRQVCSGSWGAAIQELTRCVFSEVVLIRMASDRTRPPQERYGYRNCLHGLYRITKDEGILALYRGVAPNVVRPPSSDVVLSVLMEPSCWVF